MTLIKSLSRTGKVKYTPTNLDDCDPLFCGNCTYFHGENTGICPRGVF